MCVITFVILEKMSSSKYDYYKRRKE